MDAPVLLRARVHEAVAEPQLHSCPEEDCMNGASGRNIGKISFFAIKLSTREQSATFHDHRSNWEFI